jgi:hypothetical protein
MLKKYFVSFILFCLMAGSAFSQGRETTAKFQDGKHPVFTEDYNFPTAIVTNVIAQRLKKDGLSPTSRRGTISSLGRPYPILSSDTLDMYFQVEGRGKKGRDGSTVNFFIAKGGNNFIGESDDPSLSRKAIRYLDDLRHDIAVSGLQQQIKQQEKSIDDAARDYKKLLKDNRKLESKRYKLQGELSGETDLNQQNKIRKKIEKLDKSIYSKQAAMSNGQRDLQQRKAQLSVLQEQLRSVK